MSTTDKSETVTLRWTEMFLNGHSVTYDHEARAGYLHVRPNPDAFASKRQVEVVDGLIIDLDDDGNVRGIEQLGRPVDLLSMVLVIDWMNGAKNGGSVPPGVER